MKQPEYAKATILDNVGARPADRDVVDTRIISDVLNAIGGNPSGQIVDCVDSDPIYYDDGTSLWL